MNAPSTRLMEALAFMKKKAPSNRSLFDQLKLVLIRLSVSETIQTYPINQLSFPLEGESALSNRCRRLITWQLNHVQMQEDQSIKTFKLTPETDVEADVIEQWRNYIASTEEVLSDDISDVTFTFQSKTPHAPLS